MIHAVQERTDPIRPNKEPVDWPTILSVLPESPGVYMHLDENDTIIYVGKAKNLKRRVASYFNKTQDNSKTRIMVRKIRNIRYLVVESEEDAFLLENNLIKEHQPRYNILLKDDKTYPRIVIKNEPFPRIFLTRQKTDDRSHYYGPYTSVLSVKQLLRFLTSLYPIRICNHLLTEENIAKGKFRLCLQYHIKKCAGPCMGLQTEDDYNHSVHVIEEILKGNSKEMSQLLYQNMMRLASEMRFEEAALLKERYEMLENYSAKSIIVNPSFNNVDVFSYDENEQSAYINYLHIAKGAIIRGYTIEYKKQLDESRETILAMGIMELRTRFESRANQLIVPFRPDIELTGVEWLVPQRGEKKKLLELSEKNVRQYKLDRLKQAETLNPEQRSTRILKTLQNDLHLQELPIHIECFDNSNIQGTNPVSSCVVFKKAKPSKKEYRHFNIKTVVGPDDFSSMYETVFRRYKRLSEEEQPFPQLIVIDGGKGQLHAAADALKALDLYGRIAVIGIAKRLEEIYFPSDPIPLYLDKNSESLKLIQQLRDEAHRFGITFHRNKRSRQQVASELDGIKGIGPVLKEKLLKKYKSVKRIKEAPPAEIEDLIGKSKAEILFRNFHPAE
ncbi:MAG: excinuclease ABC subunit UvrC [Dysgonamonadaceae bacterium]|jgi:excinuclease ABC subunit C|nr:excinuclease ABC subunit UvrC [Dysgonamonadaceae bacterium]